MVLYVEEAPRAAPPSLRKLVRGSLVQMQGMGLRQVMGERTWRGQQGGEANKALAAAAWAGRVRAVIKS